MQLYSMKYQTNQGTIVEHGAAASIFRRKSTISDIAFSKISLADRYPFCNICLVAFVLSHLRSKLFRSSSTLRESSRSNRSDNFALFCPGLHARVLSYQCFSASRYTQNITAIFHLNSMGLTKFVHFHTLRISFRMSSKHSWH